MKSILSVLIIFICLCLYTCKVKDTFAPMNSFQQNIQGDWKGKLYIYSTNGKNMEIPMSISVLKTNSDSILTWTMTYDVQEPRKYELHIINASKGLYQIDELNGIVIPALHRGSELITNYEVMGNHMTVIYDLTSQSDLLFKVNMWRTSNGKITGDTIMGGDTIPKVTTFLPTTYQIAKLKKVK
jgi:hypothetical protein